MLVDSKEVPLVALMVGCLVVMRVSAKDCKMVAWLAAWLGLSKDEMWELQ